MKLKEVPKRLKKHMNLKEVPKKLSGLAETVASGDCKHVGVDTSMLLLNI